MAEQLSVCGKIHDVIQRPSYSVSKYTFTWYIANFSKIDILLKSASFCPIPARNIRFYVSLCLNTDSMDMLLSKVDYDDQSVSVNFETTFFNGRGNTCWRKTNTSFIFGRKRSYCFFSLPYTVLTSDLPLLSAISELLFLPDDALMIKCIMDFSVRGMGVHFCNLKRLSCDFKRMFKDERFSDVLLRVGKRKIPAHKCVLYARSSTFKDLLDSSFANTYITIANGSIPVAKALIYYLYTGMVEDLSLDFAIDLYPLAKAYNVYNLQRNCADIMEAMLTMKNACKILKLAEEQHDTRLKMAVCDFIFMHFEEISTTSEWYDILDNERRLATCVLRFVAQNISHVP